MYSIKEYCYTESNFGIEKYERMEIADVFFDDELVEVKGNITPEPQTKLISTSRQQTCPSPAVGPKSASAPQKK